MKAIEFATKLVLRTANWLKAALTYQITDTDYSSKTDPAFDPFFVAGRFSRRPDFGRTLPRTNLWVELTYSRSCAVTADNGNPSIVPYRGNIYTFTTTATYALNAKNRSAKQLHFFPCRL